ncbi:tRNA (adenosine(37)-N6)-threonylcarbamoyltransferase complex dimerization subunit type 1 TsaB [Candidatus Berkelbacteria bacterium RBG_13_40_8]|uniref:tRNA (Adenosine(37)-N6)-threonylcarbamoyltransferase complex dimerization subunit type 1 TsaB n=1 Tax=Candidatus Berkelbacteria bacterium RBG_13_40_8 TaxID=1797467 RepID=A0A1F5DP55_9BACT|nr:MAG: tRNA (adenosine(37)-N6)-threonylcarbamoyltransferase complex dimerization subunit type 1 TsaB [Candidatus Berkelbacteria bacterium RBG_13_40_8]
MTLIIDTNNRSKIELGLYGEGVLSCFVFNTEKQSEDLVVAIEGVLRKEKLSLQDIDSILVNQGPGSFTGVRVGVTVANTLGWSLDKPVFGFKDGEQDLALKKLSTSKISKFSKIVLPYYSR